MMRPAARSAGQVGDRWQLRQVVLGVEGQGNWADFSGSNLSQAFPGFSNPSKLDAFGLITGQIGYALNNVLLYAKGDAAVTGDSYRILDAANGALAATASDNTRWAARSVRVSKWDSRPTGRLASNTITCSCRTARSPSPRRLARGSLIASIRMSMS